MYSASLAELASALAPGAWLAALALVLLHALGRWYDRVPRRVAAVFGLALVLFFGEVLLGGEVLLPLDSLRGEVPFRALPATEPHGNLLQGDLLYLIHPLRLEVRRAVAAGEWPLWAPHLGAGMPLLADPQAQALQPLAAAGLVLGPVAAPGAVAALRTFVALVFAYLLLARLGAGRGPALAGALAYGLGGFLQLWLGWPLANTAALLPAVLYAVVLADERGRRRDWALLALTLAALLVAGHPETIGYALALAVGLITLRLARRPGGLRGGFAARAAASLAVAACLAASALLPAAAQLPDTLRWQRMARHASEAGPAPVPAGDAAAAAPATRLVQVAAPNALGNSRFVHYWGRANSNEDAAGFVGTAALLAALLALPGWLAGARGAPLRPLRHEGAALLLAAACLALLALPAGALGRVPAGGLSGRLALPLDLALAVLAAASLERFRRRELPAWLPYAALPALAAALGVLHAWVVPAFARPGAPETLELLRGGWLHWHLRFLAAASLVLAIGRRRRWAAWAVAALLAAELLLAHRSINPPMPRRLAFPATAAVTALVGTGGGDAATRVAASGRAFPPNLAAVYGAGDARVYDPVAPAPYLALLEPGIASWWGEIPLLASTPDAQAAALYDRLAIGRWLVAPDAPCPDGSREVYAGPDGRVCRRPGALPPVRLGGGGALAAAVEAPGGDRWRLELAGAAGGESQAASPLQAAGVLETAIYAAPGWRALADGRAIPVRGPVLLAATVPAGTRRADLLYRPAPFLAGCVLAALGVALALAAWARPPAVRP